MSDVEQFEARLAELRDERNAAEVTMTKDDLVAKVGEHLQIARAAAAGSSRLALGGRATGEHLEALLAEDLLADDGLAGRIIGRLERQGFGEVSDRQKKQRLAKVDAEIAKVTGELREARKREAFERIEAEFAGEAA